MKYLKNISLGIIAVFFISFVVSPTSYAGTCVKDTAFLTVPTWYKGVCKDGTNDVQIEHLPGDVIKIILNVFSMFLVVISYVAVTMVIFGGIKYVISIGDPAKATAARQTIQNALIGLLLALAALAIVNFVTGTILK